MGLTSHFRAAIDALLPTFNANNDVVEIMVDMSPYQLSQYNKIRNVEINKEKAQLLNHELQMIFIKFISII